MTWDEFDGTWFPAHKAAFTGIQEFFRKQTTGTEAPTYEAILKGWYLVLRDVELDAALNATIGMKRGDIEEPVGYDRHPRAIRKAAGVSHHKRQMPWNDKRYDADGSQTFSCLLCEDDGWVLCWHPVTVAEVAKNGLPDCKAQALYTAVFRCTCHAGNLRPQVGEAPRFDPRRLLPYKRERPDEESRRELLDWIENREPIRPDNYERAFE